MKQSMRMSALFWLATGAVQGAVLENPSLPPTQVLWSLADASTTKNALRETICLNGLWQFKPEASSSAKGVPEPQAQWFYFKVPGIWPAQGNGGAQYACDAAGRSAPFKGELVNNAWYRRTIEIPADWTGKRVELEVGMIQSCGQVFVDSARAGEFYYPGGLLDITRFVKPGRLQELAILVSAKADPEASKVYMAPDRLVTTSKAMANRGITGDMFLHARPTEMLINDVHAITSVRKGTVTCDVGLRDLRPGRYSLEAAILDCGKVVKEFKSPQFDVAQGAGEFRTAFGSTLENPKLWDIDAPQNLYQLEIRLKNAAGELLDMLLPEEFGFREFRIEGRDFYLNDKKIHLRTLVGDNTIRGASQNTPNSYDKLEKQAKSLGVNFYYAENYSFAPGKVSYLDAFYRETSKRGILTSLTLPHGSQFKWELKDPAVAAQYRRQAEFLIRRFQNLPGVVLYAACHNSMGYSGDKNPLRIDGVYKPDAYMEKYTKRQFDIRREGEIIGDLIRVMDSSRPVYFHESGAFGDIYSINCYLNWAPRQERSDWFLHWAEKGRMPLILVEWGMPHVASWSSFRGPAFIWSADGLQCVWYNEYNAAILGEEAYRVDNYSKLGLMDTQERLGARNTPYNFGKINWFCSWQNTQKVWGYMINDNFRSFRALGVSGIVPWDFGAFWKLHPPGKTAPYPDRFNNLKQPGMVPDQLGVAVDAQLSVAGEVAQRWWRPQIGWIGGKAGDFTEKGHNFRPGEDVRKQLIIVNDSRGDAAIAYKWDVPALRLRGEGSAEVPPGGRVDIPLAFTIPSDFKAGKIALDAAFKFSDGSKSVDSFTLDICPPPVPQLQSQLGLFDPENSAAPLLRNLGVKFIPVEKAPLPTSISILVVGRNALDKLPFDLRQPLAAGLKLLILEQPYAVLSKLGLRANEYGLREIFPVAPGFNGAMIHDWRGAATLYPPYLDCPELEVKDPQWNWNGFAAHRVWRCGNRGSVCSVPIEKPCVGDWMPLLQGGFDLQYAPVLEYRQGAGRIIFSQLDLSERTENDPEAAQLLGKMLERLDHATPLPVRPTWYLGDERGAAALRHLRVNFQLAAPEQKFTPDSLLILGPGARPGALVPAIESGLQVLALGMSQAELEKLFPGRLALTTEKSYSDYANGLAGAAEFAGVSNSDVHWRQKLEFAAFAKWNSGGRALHVLHLGKGRAVFCQVAPWMFTADEFQFRTSLRRNNYLVSRLAHNLGATSDAGLFAKFSAETALPESFDLSTNWLGLADPQDSGRKEGYAEVAFRPGKEWRPVKVPGLFEPQFKDLGNYDGLFWYRKAFDLPAAPKADMAYTLYIGVVDDESYIWLNGKFLGEVTEKTNPNDCWGAERVYKIRGGDLKATGNVLVVLCNDRRMCGGILGTPVLRCPTGYRLYSDTPHSEDNPYRYYPW